MRERETHKKKWRRMGGSEGEREGRETQEEMEEDGRE